MGRSILVAVDASEASQAVALWAAHNLARPGDSFHVVAIAPPIAYAMTPPAPIASAGAVRDGRVGGATREVGWVGWACNRVPSFRCACLAPWEAAAVHSRASLWKAAAHPNSVAALACSVQVAALSLSWEQQRRAEEEQCRALLHEVRPPSSRFV